MRYSIGDLRQLGEKLLGKISANITLDKDNNEENKTAYKTGKNEATKNVAIAKTRAYGRLYSDMDTTEGQNILLRMA